MPLRARGHRVRVVDSLIWGADPIRTSRDAVDLRVADIRDFPLDALDGVAVVIHLAGLSKDPAAEYAPAANWEMNALATERLGLACVEQGVERLVSTSSCSLCSRL